MTCKLCGRQTNDKKGICAVCQVEAKTTEKPETATKKTTKREYCKYPGCTKWPHRKGYCAKHLKSLNPQEPPPKSVDCAEDTQSTDPFFTWLEQGINSGYFEQIKKIREILNKTVGI